jgi:hypothetical protein
MDFTTDNAETLRSAVRAVKMPFCTTGDIPISRNNPIKLLFEGPGHSVTFPLSSSDNINPLLDACKQASFGRGGEEVLDPSYRRALVLHATSFAIAPASAIDPCGLGILSQIREALVSSSSATDVDIDGKKVHKEQRIAARLDKLNVYGEGDFFKGHIDTPRSNQMFGTLLINLPVAHEGGDLVVYAPYLNSNDGDEDDSNVVPSSDADPGQRDSYTTTWGAEDVLSWIAFFSDCPHEVLPVTRGKR